VLCACTQGERQPLAVKQGCGLAGWGAAACRRRLLNHGQLNPGLAREAEMWLRGLMWCLNALPASNSDQTPVPAARPRQWLAQQTSRLSPAGAIVASRRT
jgi:hypothetical protein